MPITGQDSGGHINTQAFQKKNQSCENILIHALCLFRFLLHPTDSRMRVWRLNGEGMDPRHLQGKVAYGGGSVMVWGGISEMGKTDLVISK